MKKRKTVAIVAGGTLDEVHVSRIRNADYLIGVDRGAHWLVTNGIVPDIAIGDFDSVTKKEFLLIKKNIKHVVQYPKEKDSTDLELAVNYAIARQPKEVCLFGAIGSRFDHGFAGIMMLLKLSSHNIYGYIVDNFNEIYVVRRILEIVPSRVFRYVSLFSLTNSATVTLSGFLYNVSRRRFVRGSTLGVSNEMVKKSAQITVHDGLVLVVRSRD